jgi:hypothetical protein
LQSTLLDIFNIFKQQPEVRFEDNDNVENRTIPELGDDPYMDSVWGSTPSVDKPRALDEESYTDE